MKIFLDTANIESIQKWAHTGLIDGVTTNPTHLSKEGNNPTEQVLAICDILPSGVISVEVTEVEPDNVYLQARKIASLSDNIAVKIPCHPNYYSVIKKLINEGILINITLVFSLAQGLMMAKLGAQYISPFIGRLDDLSAPSTELRINSALREGGSQQPGIELLQHLRHMIDWYDFDTELLAASIRDVAHFEQALIAGADIVTVPVAVFENSLTHQLTDKGMAQFLSDWKKLNITRFP